MTSANACENIVSDYLKVLSSNFDTTPSDKGCFVLTPFNRPDGEGIELELEALPSGNVRITDMGDTFGYLYINGLTLSRALMDSAKHISMGYGVSLDRAMLVIESDSESVGNALHELVQATLAVTDLIQKRRPSGTRKARFDNEVESFIIYSGVTYDAGYEVRGVREKHEFRFHINSDRNLLIQPITAATEAAAHTWAERWEYRFIDTIEANSNWRLVAVLDDRSTTEIWTPHALAPIENHAILWDEKNRLAQLLAGSHT